MRKKAFTLIELLVVIAIIALLASVVLASLNAAREKGRMKSVIYFATQIDHIAGEQAVGLWDYDECSGTSVADRSGFGNGASFGAGISFSSLGDTPSGAGCSLVFDGTVGLNYGGNFTPFKFGMGDFTISGWINPIVPPATNGDGSTAGIFESFGSGIIVGFGLGSSAGSISSLEYRLQDSNGTNLNTALPNIVPLNKWTHLVMVVDRTNTNKLYIYLNGNILTSASISSLTGNFNLVNTMSSGGNFRGTVARLTGKLDSVHVFAKSLTASEVGRLYAEGLTSHPLASTRP